MATERKKVPRKKPRRGRTQADRFPLIEKALKKLTKADLVDLAIKLSKEHSALPRALESELDVQKPVQLLVSDIEVAIGLATDVDDMRANYNFDYDCQAYDEVKQGFEQLIAMGHLESVKALAVRLMKDGSYQVERSDEGLMTDDIQACLKPVIRAVKAEGGTLARKWAFEMLLADRGGFICERALKGLAGQS